MDYITGDFKGLEAGVLQIIILLQKIEGVTDKDTDHGKSA